MPANNRDSATITVRATPPQPPPPTTPSTTQPIALTGENLLTQLVDALLLRSIASTLRAYSALSGLILRRVGPFLGAILADGAGPDPELREFLATIERERRIGNTGIVTHIRDRFGLPHGLTLDRAIDHVWTLTASEIADRLIRRCGSTVDAYESWLSDQLRAGFRSRD
ncbi:MAG TPA: hypothetical protein VH395_06690 [Jatrophihabitantaceae bacterium]